MSSASSPDLPHVYVGPICMAEGTLRTTNEELARRFGTTPEVIFRKIGIESRPLATRETTPKALALEAARPLIEHLHFDPASLALVIASSSSISQVCPPVACEILGEIQTRDAAVPHAMAFDIMATCTGWLYGLTLACDQLNQPGNGARCALVVTTEIFSQGLDPNDFAAWASFGDVATATLVYGPDADAAAIGQPGTLRMDRPHCFAKADVNDTLWGPPLNMEAKLRMDGRALRAESMPLLVAGLRAALDRAGLRATDLRTVLAHQSNQRVLEELAAELGIESSRMASNMKTRGNTSSSALPLLLHDLRRGAADGIAAGAQLGFTAFGGGFTYGGATAQVIA